MEILRALENESEYTLENSGITFQQLEDLFVKINYHFEIVQTRSYRDFTYDEHKKIISRTRLLDRVEIWEGTIFHGKYKVRTLVWPGCEHCLFLDGGDYGCSREWFFTRDDGITFYLSDLTLHEIVHHHIFRTLDPVELLNFFNLVVGKSYKTETNGEEYWCLRTMTTTIQPYLDETQYDPVETSWGTLRHHRSADTIILSSNNRNLFPGELQGYPLKPDLRTISWEYLHARYELVSSKIPTDAELEKEW
jgi:hypothetical protein